MVREDSKPKHNIHTHPASGEFVLEEEKDRPLCRPESDGGLEKWESDKMVECGTMC